MRRPRRELILPYSLAIGAWNAIFTVCITMILAFIFSFRVTLGIFIQNYIFGYIVLWILNLKIIEE